MPYPHPILVVDDSELALEMGKDVLEECGFRAYTTPDPTTVVDILRQTPIEIILLDMMMPQKSGLEVMQDIRAIESSLGRSIMIFVITGMTDRQTALAALKAGAYFYMTKPLRREALLPSLQTCIAQLEQARDPASLDASRALRDRISQARAQDASANDVQLRQPEQPNAYPHPILSVGVEDSKSGAIGVPLLAHGYHVLDCPKTDRALLLFASHPVDILILNLNTPLDTLAKLLEQIRAAALAVRRRVSVIVAVEADQEGDQKALLAAGATICLPRPIDEAELLKTVDWAARRALGG